MATEKKPYVIVVGVDYSETGDLALSQAFQIGAAMPKAEIHAVSVSSLRMPVPSATPEAVSGFAGGAPGVPLDESSAELRRHVQRSYDDFVAQAASGTAIERIVTHVRLEAPAEEIAQLAADLEADLVIVGTHGRRGLSRLLLGSVAEGVVRLAPCPVLVVRPKRIVEAPRIEPPCPECVKVRQASHGQVMWCEQHSQRHGQRHTYHGGERISADGTMPLVYNPR